MFPSLFLVLSVIPTLTAQKCAYKLDTCPQRKSANKIYVGKKCTELTVNNTPCVIDQKCDKSTPFCVEKIGINRNSEISDPSVVLAGQFCPWPIKNAHSLILCWHQAKSKAPVIKIKLSKNQTKFSCIVKKLKYSPAVEVQSEIGGKWDTLGSKLEKVIKKGRLTGLRGKIDNSSGRAFYFFLGKN